MRKALVVLFVICLALPARAEKSLTVSEALSLLMALRNLDGHLVNAKVQGQETWVMVPWEFGSGVLRLKIMSDINALAAVEKNFNDARASILKETKDKPEEAQTQLQQALDASAQVGPLSRIRASDLKLDKNEIPGTALAALTPILDVDVPLQ